MMIKTKTSDLMRFIESEDRNGKNMTKEQMANLYNSEDFNQHYETLLLCGEIFVIEDKVYPITTTNDGIYND